MHDVLAEESGRASGIDPVCREQDHPTSGGDGGGARPRPGHDLGARRKGGEHRAHRRGREVVRGLHDEGVASPRSSESRRQIAQQGVGVAVAGAVQAGERAELAARGPGLERADGRFDPRR